MARDQYIDGWESVSIDVEAEDGGLIDGTDGK